jgi:hypothetical protein
MPNPPWVSGPEEILKHGLSLLNKDSDVNRRLAMISIDNAVELMIKTYLGLPKRVTGINLSRRSFQEISESFPRLLDALEEHSDDKLAGIELGEIEWYHRVRNELYHEGHGLTVELEKVKVYSELAKALFRNLFGVDLNVKEDASSALLGEFLSEWVKVEKNLKGLFLKWCGHESIKDNPHTIYIGAREMLLTAAGHISRDVGREIDSLRTIRNRVIHGEGEIAELLTSQIIERVRTLNSQLNTLLKEEKSE